MFPAVIVALALVAVIVGPMFGSPMGGTDDHEVPVIQRDIAAGGLVQAFERRDMGDGRFRPAYWMFRIAETVAWGENTTGWYLGRAFLLLTTILAAFALFWRYADVTGAVLGSAMLVAGPQAEAFFRMGPQESYGMALSVAGFALVAYRRFGLGLALLVAAAFTKEPFVVSSAAGVAWAWWLGARRSALLATSATAIAAAGVGLTFLHSGLPYVSGGLPIPWSGRYLYPWLLLPALAVAWLVARHRWLVVPVAVLLAFGVVQANRDAVSWRSYADAFGALEARLSADPRPVVFLSDSPFTAEPAVAMQRYLPDKEIGLVAPVNWPGFATVRTHDCIEVSMYIAPDARCSTSIRFP